eukprot:SAG11_NODE_1579_length_4652_cov_5.253459_1_plen_261_part_00
MSCCSAPRGRKETPVKPSALNAPPPRVLPIPPRLPPRVPGLAQSRSLPTLEAEQAAAGSLTVGRAAAKPAGVVAANGNVHATKSLPDAFVTMQYCSTSMLVDDDYFSPRRPASGHSSAAAAGNDQDAAAVTGQPAPEDVYASGVAGKVGVSRLSFPSGSQSESEDTDGGAHQLFNTPNASVDWKELHEADPKHQDIPQPTFPFGRTLWHPNNLQSLCENRPVSPPAPDAALVGSRLDAYIDSHIAVRPPYCSAIAKKLRP